MDLLDRLRPRWRHADPAVRAAVVREMGPEDAERLATLACDDPDPRVRKAAIEKLDDAAVLARIAEAQQDPALRTAAIERGRHVLVAVAVSAGPSADCEAALGRLDDPQSLATVAATAAHEAVRRAALARVEGDRGLRDVVRQAGDAATRRAALERIRDPGVLRSLVSVEMPADLAVEAVERIDDRVVLHGIAESRTAPKAARRRARARLAVAASDEPAVGLKQARARQLELASTVHALRSLPDPIRAAERAEEAEREWMELARAVEPRPDVADAFAAACRALFEEAARLGRRRAEADEARRALDAGLAARVALCEHIDALDGAEVPRLLADARAAWGRLAAVPAEQAGALRRRFDDACDRAAARHERWRDRDAARAAVERLVEEAEAAAEASPPPPRKRWSALEQQWASRDRAVAGDGEPDPLAERFAAAGDRLRRRWAEAERLRSERERENVGRLEALCRRLHELAASEGLKPSAGRRELEFADAALADPGPLPPSERRASWMERVTDARDALVRRVAQEEHTEEWRRWANVGAQEEIIARVEALLASNDLAEGTRQLGHLQEEWAAVATASPEKSQALWERFRTARNQLRKRCDAYLAENLEKKRALCAQVAGLGESTAWNETADAIRRLQAEWKAIGPVPGKQTQALREQFRGPCDRFFERRKAHFERLDGERRENAQAKRELCERAEALADSTDWEATTAAMKELQAAWKRSGPPPRAEADALWARFRTACDRFFDRRSRRGELAREEAAGAVRTLCEGLEALAVDLDREDGPPIDEVGRRLDEGWAAWLRVDAALLDDADAATSRVAAACAAIAGRRPESVTGTRLDPRTTAKRREKLCARLEALVPADREAARPSTLEEMARGLRDRLATNTIAGPARDPGRPDRREEIARVCAAWAHLGPPLDDAARALAERFERARAALRPRAS
jgi:hypothetical protein